MSDELPNILFISLLFNQAWLLFFFYLFVLRNTSYFATAHLIRIPRRLDVHAEVRRQLTHSLGLYDTLWALGMLSGVLVAVDGGGGEH